LIFAAENGYIDVVSRFAIAAGAHVVQMTYSKTTAWIHAAEQ